MHGAIVGVLGIVMGLSFMASFPLWYNVVSVVGIVPFGMLGGRLAVINSEESMGRALPQ